MPLTLRPTKGFGPDHFSAFEGQRKIGRIYKTRENGWFWGVDWFEAGFKPVADYAATREQALADLQNAWNELLWAKVLDAQRRVRNPETISRASEPDPRNSEKA
jgi:hypothetical protein